MTPVITSPGHHGAAIRPAPVADLARPEGPPRHWPVLGEARFTELLVRERKRSERTNRPFILLLVARRGDSRRPAPATGQAILKALRAATRGTDVVGWLQWPRVGGAIFLELGAVDPTRAVERIQARIQHELRHQLDPRDLRRYRFAFRVYPEPGPASTEDGQECDLAFRPDLRGEAQNRRWSDGLKRTVDVAGSLALLVMFAPVLLVLATLVHVTSPGPVLFRQVRLGTMGRPFRMLKFRTMYMGSEERTHHEFVTRFIKESGSVAASGEGRYFKLRNDPRVTPVGRILRKTSMDELPQLWNVLIGEMSLVGPRPPLPYELVHYAPWHRRRLLEAKPGVTGLWQVIGRSRTTFDEMVRLDLHYARRRSLWMDLWILLRTPGAVLSCRGAG